MWKTRIVTSAVGITCLIACSPQVGFHLSDTIEGVRGAKHKTSKLAQDQRANPAGKPATTGGGAPVEAGGASGGEPGKATDSKGGWFKLEFGKGGATLTKECPSENDNSLAPDVVIQREMVTLKREFQRTIRRDCEDNVLSDKIETVSSPSKHFKIKAKQWTKLGQVIGTATNRTTCDHNGLNLDKLWDAALKPFSFLAREYYRDLKARMGFPDIEFVVDTSPSLSHMRVLKNRDNYIDYEFKKCEDSRYNAETKTYECHKTSAVEKGTLILTVEYEETTLPGTREIRECGDKN